ncbi:abc transporter g family member 28 [Holotrichia oblita]|uniref:Abc transporter g family member 28 n=1 Tax=Holotrichia oblita TaxID=644536 RepID=A0ACB9TA99_HOLOL|nr:abc transporter g family member 28 [Holotrichia oblita]
MAADSILLQPRNQADVKIDIIPSQPKTLTHLPKRPKVDLSFEDLKYTVHQQKSEKIILKCVSGQLRSGELTAIMGPSGAGKSTLLNILTGYKTRGLEGNIYVNNFPRNLSQFRKLSAYIMQDNQLHANLTVDEAMTVAAKLKIGSKKAKEREEIVREKINEILDTLGLREHRSTMTSGLSGGQKKRLSIALELVSNPPVMFFDEPTSGLDSSSCFQCISLLRTLASGGRTIICTIHQPSARLFEMFDQLYTLADGQCVYQGSTKQLVPFLGTLGLQCPSYHNPASFIIEVACGEYGDNTKKLVEAIDNGKEDIKLGQPFPQRHKEVLNNGSEKYPETQKNLNENTIADKFTNAPNDIHIGFEGIVSEVSKGVANGSSVANEKSENVDSSLLEDSISTTQQPRYGTSQFNQFFIVLKRALLFSRRDWAIFCIIYVTIVYFMTSQPYETSRFGMFLAACLLVSFVAQSVGLVVGAAMNVQNGVFLAPVMSVPFLLFSGFFVSFDAIPIYLRWITYLSYIRYGFEGTALATYSFNRPKLMCSVQYCHFKDPTTTLEELDMLNANYNVDIIALIAIFLVLRISAYFFLRWKLKSNRA